MGRTVPKRVRETSSGRRARKMNLLSAVCLCTLASYAVAEEAVEHRSSGGEGGEEQTRIFSLGNSGLIPIVPASTSLLQPLIATPYHIGVGGFPGGFTNTNNFSGNGGFLNNYHFPGGGHHNQFPGNGGHGGYPNNNNYPGQSSSCKYWCKTPGNQYYCCEGQNQQIGGGGGGIGGGNVGTKPGFCPPVRPSCPPTRIHGPPRQCSNDYSCSGRDKCCFDTCLQHHTCKPTQGGGIYG